LVNMAHGENVDPPGSNRALVWSVIFLHMLNHVISGSMPILYPEIMEEFDLNYAQLGLLRSASTFSSGFPQMFVGWLRRWFSGRVLVGVGNLVNSLGNIAASLSRGLWSFLGLTVVAGVGSSTQHPVGASLITAATDPRERGRMLGLNQSFPSLAFSFTPLLAAYMLNLMGWRRALAILSTPAILLSLVLLFFVRGTSQVEAPSRDALNLSKLREQLRNRNVLAISVLRTAMAFRMGVRTFLPLYFIDVLGLSTAQSSLLYSVLLFGGVFGPFFWGSLSDRVNRRPLIIGIMVASGLGYLSLLWVKGFTALLVLLFLLGFMVQTVVVQSVLSDSVPRSQLDQVFGLYFTLGFTVASFSSIIFGYVVEYWGFHAGFVYIAAVTLVSMVPAFFIEEPRTWTNQPSTI